MSLASKHNERMYFIMSSRTRMRTPMSNFILPLLEAIDAAGGTERKSEVYESLLDRMELLPNDLKVDADGYRGFHRSLNFLVANMRKAGLLEEGAGDNSLTITDAGRLLLGKTHDI